MTLHNADCLEVMRTLPENSVHAEQEHLFSAEERATDEREETCARQGCKRTMEDTDTEAGEFFCFHDMGNHFEGHCHLHIPTDCVILGHKVRTKETNTVERDYTG